jgi:hypothetical protein
MQDDKADSNYPQTIPEHILPAQHILQHHRSELIRASGYTITLEGRLAKDVTYRGRRHLQIITECKYCTDGNTHDIIENIYVIYEPLKLALRTHGTIKADIKIIPIVISKTSTVNVKTLAEIAQLVAYNEEPPDIMTYKQLSKQAKNILQRHYTNTHKNASHTSRITPEIYSQQNRRQRHHQIPHVPENLARRHHFPGRRDAEEEEMSKWIWPIHG